MSSANTVVNTLNWVGKVGMGLEVALLTLAALAAAAVLLSRDRSPWYARRAESRTKKWKAAAALMVALIMIVLAVDTIFSAKPFAKTYRTVKGGLLVGAMVA